MPMRAKDTKHLPHVRIHAVMYAPPKRLCVLHHNVKTRKKSYPAAWELKPIRTFGDAACSISTS